MKTTYIILAANFLIFYHVELNAESLLDSATSTSKFYQEAFKDCDDCKTITIIVSKNKLDKDLLKSFKSISERFGKKHMGTTMSKLEVWDMFEVFDRYNCKALDQFESRFIIYIDKDEKYCGLLPFKTNDHLMSIVSLIRKNLDNAKIIAAKRWGKMAKISIDDYSKSNAEVSAAKVFIYDFIDYIDNLVIKNFVSK